MTFFSNIVEGVTIDSIDELLDYWHTKLLAEGHTPHFINTTTGAPASDRRFGRETVYQLVNGGFIDFLRADPSSAAQEIQVQAFAGWSGLHAVTAVSQTTTNVTLTSAGLAAAVQVGDFVYHNAAADPLNNVRPQARGTEGTNYGVVTSVSAPNVTYALGTNSLSQTRSCGAGGYAWAQYNTVGGTFDIGTGTSGAMNIRITEGAALTVVGVADEDGLECIVKSPGVATWIIKAGHFARTHLPSGRNGRGLLTEDAVGDGSSQVTVHLDRPADFEVGQSVLIIPNDSAYPNTGGEIYSSTQLQAVTVVSQPSATEVVVVLPNHTFPAGSSFGADPLPLGVFGYRTAPGATTPINNSNYFSASFCLCGVTGSRATHWGTLFLDSGCFPLMNLSNATVLNSQDPSADGYYHCATLMLPIDGTDGVRAFKNMAAVVQDPTGATPADGDVLKTGPEEYWTVFDPPNLGSTTPSSRITFIVGPSTTGTEDYHGVFFTTPPHATCTECNEIELTLEAQVAPNDGGYVVSFASTGASEGAYRVYLLLDDSGTYVKLLPDLRGNGERVAVDSNGSFSLLLPPLPVGGPYRIQGYSVTGPEVTLISNQFLTIVPAQVRSGVFSLRGLMPEALWVGSRSPQRLKFPQN